MSEDTDAALERPSSNDPVGDGTQGTDTVSTRIISSRPIEVEGAAFHWWAVGEQPSLVTVRSPIFGSLAEFTRMEPEVFAPALARKLMEQHHDRAAELRKAFPKRGLPDEPSGG